MFPLNALLSVFDALSNLTLTIIDWSIFLFLFDLFGRLVEFFKTKNKKNNILNWIERSNVAIYCMIFRNQLTNA